MQDIFGSLQTEFGARPALQTALTKFDTCHVASGYSDLRGWARFADIDQDRGNRLAAVAAKVWPSAEALGYIAPASDGAELVTIALPDGGSDQ